MIVLEEMRFNREAACSRFMARCSIYIFLRFLGFKAEENAWRMCVPNNFFYLSLFSFIYLLLITVILQKFIFLTKYKIWKSSKNPISNVDSSFCKPISSWVKWDRNDRDWVKVLHRTEYRTIFVKHVPRKSFNFTKKKKNIV